MLNRKLAASVRGAETIQPAARGGGACGADGKRVSPVISPTDIRTDYHEHILKSLSESPQNVKGHSETEVREFQKSVIKIYLRFLRKHVRHAI